MFVLLIDSINWLFSSLGGSGLNAFSRVSLHSQECSPCCLWVEWQQQLALLDIVKRILALASVKDYPEPEVHSLNLGRLTAEIEALGRASEQWCVIMEIRITRWRWTLLSWTIEIVPRHFDRFGSRQWYDFVVAILGMIYGYEPEFKNSSGPNGFLGHLRYTSRRP